MSPPYILPSNIEILIYKGNSTPKPCPHTAPVEYTNILVIAMPKRNITPVLTEDTLKRVRIRSPELVSRADSGTRKISLSLLLSPPASCPSSRSTSSSLQSEEILKKTVRVPTELYSVETYQFLGFNETRSADLFQRYLTVTNEELSFLDIAVGFVTYNSTNAFDDSDDWYIAMETIGVNPQLQLALMDPEARHIRLTNDLVAWLVEIFTTNFLSLEDMNQTVSTCLDEQDNATMPNLRGGDGPSKEVLVLENHTAFYKALGMSRMQGTFHEDGTVDLNVIKTKTASDFKNESGPVYFTVDRWVADHYAMVLKKWVAIPDIRILEIYVPNEHLMEMNPWNLAYDDQWRQLIFYSRRDQGYPGEWRKHHSRQKMIVGPVASNANQHFCKMKSWDQIRERHILASPTDPSVKGTQHVWMKRTAVDLLSDAIRGKAYLRRTYPEFKLVIKAWDDVSNAIE